MDKSQFTDGEQHLFSVIREQREALEGVETSRRALEAVLEHLLGQNRGVLRMDSAPAPDRNGKLSKRELQVLSLMVAGKTSKEMAAELGISFKTAVTHRASIMSKLDVHETASVVREAFRRGLVPPVKPDGPDVR